MIQWIKGLFGGRKGIDQESIERFFGEVASAYDHDGYSPGDRYSDFRDVFLGTEKGRRVFYEIIGWGGLYRSDVPPPNQEADPIKLWMNAGRRSLVLQVLQVTYQEPGEPSTQTNRKG